MDFDSQGSFELAVISLRGCLFGPYLIPLTSNLLLRLKKISRLKAAKDVLRFKGSSLDGRIICGGLEQNSLDPGLCR